MMIPRKKYRIELERDGETFVFLFDCLTWVNVMRWVGSMAADASIKFDWNDAALVGLRIRELAFYYGWSQHANQQSQLV